MNFILVALLLEFFLAVNQFGQADCASRIDIEIQAGFLTNAYILFAMGARQ